MRQTRADTPRWPDGTLEGKAEMTENVPVRCPGCRREHAYAPPHYPCACGAPISLALRADVPPVPIQRRTWSDSWVRIRCEECGRQQDWPAPELGCACGTLLRLPVRSALPGGTERRDGPGGTAAGRDAGDFEDGERQVPDRPAFRPVTIRTARDAVVAASRYVRWLGFVDVRTSESRPASGVDLRGPGMVARVDPSTTPTSLRAVETLWLNGLNESAVPICFSLAGYARDARARADALALPLFVLDLTGAPQPVNDAADELLTRAG